MSNSPDFLMPLYASGLPVSPDKKDRPAGERNGFTDSRFPLSTGNNAYTTPTRPRRTTQSYQKLVFTDPIAFRYLEEDPATIVIDRRRRLEGYQIYIVEQWACSRTHPTFIICTYTGDASHSSLVNVLGVPKDEDSWSPRLKLYLKSISKFHAREKETPLGLLMVTNLSGFPSNLTVIPVPDGDVRKHRNDFLVNENLKRMGCSGRAAINLQTPQPSTVAKFHQLYRTSESVGTYQSVTELVRICQTALVIYDKLEETYADGLLCDITEKAIGEWWTEIGIYFYNIEPNDGVLGPTTVAAILGLLIGAYNRLKAFGAPVGKEILDLQATKRAIGHFQKSMRMEKTRRLDRETLDRLHRATAKSASGEGWIVPKAVKTTVAELSGKGGEMVMGIVGGRDKAGISEAETLDIDKLAQLVTGPKMKWLWLGKQIKSGEFLSTALDDFDGRIFSTDDRGGFIWTGKRDNTPPHRLERAETQSSQLLPEGKSGFGRIKDAVGGLKPHQRGHRDADDLDHYERPATPSARSSTREDSNILGGRMEDTGAFDMALKQASPTADRKTGNQLRPARSSMDGQLRSHREQLKPAVPTESPRKQKIQAEMEGLRNDFRADIYQNFSAAFEYDGPRSKALRRSQSALHVLDPGPDNPRQNRLNRQLSFSLVENTILGFRDVLAEEGESKADEKRPIVAMAAREAKIAAAQRRTKRVLQVQQALIPFTENKVGHVETLNRDAQQHLEELNSLYFQKLDEYQGLRATSSDVVTHEKGTLNDSLKRVEMLGAKLDYELNALQSRMQEVEDGITDFERNVLMVETRVRELAGADEQPIKSQWLVRLINLLNPRK